MNTLKKIHKIDPLFIEELKNLIKQKKCEFIFSGKEQIISPLVPKEINERNLIDGFNETKRISRQDHRLLMFMNRFSATV